MADSAALTFSFTATRKVDKARLHLVNRGIGINPFVVCGNYDITSNTWDWGTYCGDLKEALSAFVEKCKEHDFNEVFEGYLEMRN